MSLINKKSFMAELRSLLAFMDGEDRARVLNRYEAMFEEAGPEGEEALIRCFGSPVRQVLAIEREYREAVDKGEMPFAEERAAVPAPAPAAAESVPEAYEDTAVESFEEVFASAPEEIPPKEPIPELDETAWEPDREETQEDAGTGAPPEEAVPEETPVEGSPAEEPSPEEPITEEAQEEVTEEEAAAEPAPALEEDEEPTAVPAPDLLESSEEDKGLTEDEDEEEPAEEEDTEGKDEEDEDDEDEDAEGPGAGRVIGAILVTIPLILLWALGFGISLALGLAVIAAAAALALAGGYLGGYVFSGVMTFLPDLLLVGGGALVCFALALLLLWLGLWIMLGGCILTVKLSASVYRGILGKKKGDETRG